MPNSIPQRSRPWMVRSAQLPNGDAFIVDFTDATIYLAEDMPLEEFSRYTTQAVSRAMAGLKECDRPRLAHSVTKAESRSRRKPAQLRVVR